MGLCEDDIASRDGEKQLYGLQYYSQVPNTSKKNKGKKHFKNLWAKIVHLSLEI